MLAAGVVPTGAAGAASVPASVSDVGSSGVRSAQRALVVELTDTQGQRSSAAVGGLPGHAPRRDRGLLPTPGGPADAPGAAALIDAAIRDQMNAILAQMLEWERLEEAVILLRDVLNMQRRKFEVRIHDFDRYVSLIEKLPDDSSYAQPDAAILSEELRTGCMMGMLLCLKRTERLAFILGGVFAVTDGVVTFRVYAPRAKSVEVRGEAISVAGKEFLPYALSHRDTIARFGRWSPELASQEVISPLVNGYASGTPFYPAGPVRVTFLSLT